MSGDLLGIGTSGLRAARAALEIAGDNVANASTPGYARRAVVQVTGRAGAVMTPLGRSLSAGVGVDVTGLRRISDPFRNDEARTTGGEAGRFAALKTWLEPLLAAVPSAESGIGSAIGTLFDRGSAVAAEPTELAPRAAFIAAAESLAARFRLSAVKLDEHRAALATEIGITTARISTLARNLAASNGEARRAGAGTAEAAAVADLRDGLLDELESLINVSSRVRSDGSLEISFPSGSVLVSGNEASTVVGRESGRSFQILSDPYGTTATIQPIDGGSLAGLLAAIEHGATAKEGLDRLAGSLSSAVNLVHADGAGLDGLTGRNLFDGANAATLRVAIADPDHVAAADPPGPHGNGAMLVLTGLRDNGFSERYDVLVTALATTLASVREDSAAALSSHAIALAARDAISGVNLDEEAADILRYQQAYQAAARVLSTARTLFDTLIELR